MTTPSSSWRRVGLGLVKVGTAASRCQSVQEAVAMAERVFLVHGVDVGPKTTPTTTPTMTTAKRRRRKGHDAEEEWPERASLSPAYSATVPPRATAGSSAAESSSPTSLPYSSSASPPPPPHHHRGQYGADPAAAAAFSPAIIMTRSSVGGKQQDESISDHHYGEKVVEEKQQQQQQEKAMVVGVAAMSSSLPEESSSSSKRQEKVEHKDEESIIETRRRMTREKVQQKQPTRVDSMDRDRTWSTTSSSALSSLSSSSSTTTAALPTTIVAAAAGAAAAAAEPDPSPTPPLPPRQRPSFSDDFNTTVVAKSVQAGASSSAPSSSAAGVAPDEGIMADNDDVSSSSNPDSFLNEGHAVPSTRWERAWGFASLGVGMAWGTIRQSVVDPSSSSSSSSSWITNEDRLAATLCRMRGAALKLGQMLSIQDESTILPPALAQALQRVRQGADAMPTFQLTEQLRQELGDDWRESFFRSFDDRPFAAASIGQVHHATLRDDKNDDHSHHHDGPPPRRVVVKVQYPGVAQSIHSDLRNLSMLVKWSGLAPPGLFLDNIIRVGEAELLVECDYRREMEYQLRMKQLVETDPYLRANDCYVPNVIPHLCTSQVYVSEYAPGATIDRLADIAPQEERDRIGRMILYLTMKELFDWRFMQTDPNWGNFLYDVNTGRTSLIDFGAAREYDKNFVDGYLRIVWAAAVRDANTLMAQSRKMGFLTGDENATMLRAHQLSGFTVGEPFFVVGSNTNNEPFDFRASRISERLSEHTAVFLRHRLTPPPAEVYTLHRKLAGAYMLCIKLNAKVYSRDILEEIVANHSFDDGMPNPLS